MNCFLQIFVRCRSTQILQPVQRDYAAQILTLPTGTRMLCDQPQTTPVAVVGQLNRPTLGILNLLLSQHVNTRKSNKFQRYSSCCNRRVTLLKIVYF